ncbi:MAG TPA: SRPBCC family protein [Candidatus Saccharimonadales bacterium]|nr:SRPBCC family protein [Candidatus Saccharimonadales bacterium]
MQDKIERKITINATKEQVYAAISDPTKITSWFPDSIEGKLDEGDQPILSFGEQGKTKILVVATKPHDYFAYRWVPGANHYVGDVRDTKTTLVEFKITENNGVSTLTMTESGFSKLPAEMAKTSFKQNTDGWGFMLGRLEKNFTEK